MKVTKSFDSKTKRRILSFIDKNLDRNQSIVVRDQII